MAITTRPMASHGRGSRFRSHIPAGAATAAATKVISEIVAPSANGESLNASPTAAETGATCPRQAAARTPAAIVLAGRAHFRPGTAPPPTARTPTWSGTLTGRQRWGDPQALGEPDGGLRLVEQAEDAGARGADRRG